MSEIAMSFTQECLRKRAKEYLIWLYGKPEGEGADKWMERFGLLCSFIDEQFSPVTSPPGASPKKENPATS